MPDLQGDPVPDVVIMNSCLWDVSRYGQYNSMKTFKRNIETTFSKLNSILPIETLIMWNTALPVAEEIKGGFLLPELHDLSKTMRYDVLLGNFYAKELAKCYEIDVLDLNYFFRHQMHRQVGDGVHWNYVAHRRITNLVLAHIAVSWGVGCPRGKDSLKLPDNLYYDFETEEEKASQRLSKLGDRKTDSPAYTDTKENDADSIKSDSIKGFDKDDGRSGSVSKLRNEQEGRRSRSPLELDRPRSSRSPLERDRPPSRSDSRVDPVKRHRRDRSPVRQNTPPLRGGGLSSGLELKPIDLGNIPKDTPPLIGSPGRHLKSTLPRAGGRYQPYAHPNNPHAYQNNPPHHIQPQSRPQTWFPNQSITPQPYYPQAQYTAPYPNPQPYPYYRQNAGQFCNPYNVQNLHYDNRMRQRLAAERNMEVVRGLLMNDVYRL